MTYKIIYSVVVDWFGESSQIKYSETSLIRTDFCSLVVLIVQNSKVVIFIANLLCRIELHFHKHFIYMDWCWMTEVPLVL